LALYPGGTLRTAMREARAIARLLTQCQVLPYYITYHIANECRFDRSTYRCIYTVRFSQAVYVLHVFQKKSKTGVKTAAQDIRAVRQRLTWAEDHYKQTYGVPPEGNNR
jgi:phage-related protein